MEPICTAPPGAGRLSATASPQCARSAPDTGEGHLRLVLQLMTDTWQNVRELYFDMLKAVSRLPKTPT